MVLCGLIPRLNFVDAGGTRLAAWEWPGQGRPLLFTHGTSFHGRCWDTVIRELPGSAAISLDMRGHGRSDKPAPPYDWRWFGRDVAAAAEQLGLRGAIGIGHSMGGHAMVAAAAIRPETFAALLLVDPTIFPPEAYASGRHMDASFILKRRNHWKSPDEMFERFRHRPPFAGWREEVLRDYCEFGLLAQDGAYVLACPPPVEAAIYFSAPAPEANLYSVIPSVAQPITVMRAERPPSGPGVDLAASPTAPDLAGKFPCSREIVLQGRNHFIPMETPDLVAREIAALVRAHA